MNKKIVLGLLLISGVFIVAGCELKKNSNTTTTTTTTKEYVAKYNTIDDAQEMLLNYFNHEEGVNVHYLETVTVTEEGVEKQYHKIDVRKHNSGGANSRLDVYYVSTLKADNKIIDSAAFEKAHKNKK